MATSDANNTPAPQPQPQPQQPAHLQPSELGTKEYWDNLYTTEIRNHTHDPSDVGTCWFDDSDAEAKMIEFLGGLAGDVPSDDDDGDDEGGQEQPPVTPALLDRTSTSFLDLGTGNGSLLFGLRDDGWRGRMLGVDYSERSVELARRVGEGRRRKSKSDSHDDPTTATGDDDDDDDIEDVEFAQHDIFAPLPGNRSFDVVLDKGTFDAVSLSAGVDADTGRRACEGYRGAVLPLVRDAEAEGGEDNDEGGGGLFLITSCNWTEPELVRWFCGEGEGEGRSDGGEGEWKFVQVGRVNYPSFSFGGVKGQTISSVCFRKVRR